MRTVGLRTVITVNKEVRNVRLGGFGRVILLIITNIFKVSLCDVM